MPSKKSKQQDQKWISLAEYKKNKPLRKRVKSLLHAAKKELLYAAESVCGPQTATRINNSAKRQKKSVVEFLASLERKAK